MYSHTSQAVEGQRLGKDMTNKIGRRQLCILNYSTDNHVVLILHLQNKFFFCLIYKLILSLCDNKENVGRRRMLGKED